MSVITIAALAVIWGYGEFLFVAIALTVLLVLAVWIARRPFRASVQRTVDTIRVQRGDPVRVTYWVRNDTRRASDRATLVDRCDDSIIETIVAPVASGRVEGIHAAIPTRRRGVYAVGPLDTRRLDPLGLAVGEWRNRRDTEAPTPITVHPKVYDLVGPHGASRSVENESAVRRSTADPMSGFVSMREYVPGDDTRMIHWPTTARTGVPMVREHVEVRRPEFTVVLDTSEETGSDEDFEEMVDVVATFAIHALRTGLDVVVRTTARQRPGRPTPLTQDRQVLDFLTPVERSSNDDLVPLPSLFMHGLDQTSIVMVTGPDGPSSRLVAGGSMATVRIGAEARAGTGVSFAAVDAADFASRWRLWS